MDGLSAVPREMQVMKEYLPTSEIIVTLTVKVSAQTAAEELSGKQTQH